MYKGIFLQNCFYDCFLGKTYEGFTFISCMGERRKDLQQFVVIRGKAYLERISVEGMR